MLFEQGSEPMKRHPIWPIDAEVQMREVRTEPLQRHNAPEAPQMGFAIRCEIRSSSFCR